MYLERKTAWNLNIYTWNIIIQILFCSVPITCMLIINQHVKESSDGVKGNATDVFTILIEFANDTDDVCIYF